MKKVAILAELLEEIGYDLSEITIDECITLIKELKNNVETIIKNK